MNDRFTEKARNAIEKARAAAMLAAGGGIKQSEAERGFAFFCNAPGLGIGHAHFGSSFAQGMQCVHMAQQHCNARAECLCIARENADGKDGAELRVFHNDNPFAVLSCIIA